MLQHGDISSVSDVVRTFFALSVLPAYKLL